MIIGEIHDHDYKPPNFFGWLVNLIFGQDLVKLPGRYSFYDSRLGDDPHNDPYSL